MRQLALRRTLLSLLVVLQAPVLAAQERPISGRLIDRVSGDPLQGVSVSIASSVGKGAQSQTDSNGQFVLPDPGGHSLELTVEIDSECHHPDGIPIPRGPGPVTLSVEPRLPSWPKHLGRCAPSRREHEAMYPVLEDLLNERPLGEIANALVLLNTGGRIVTHHLVAGTRLRAAGADLPVYNPGFSYDLTCQFTDACRGRAHISIRMRPDTRRGVLFTGMATARDSDGKELVRKVFHVVCEGDADFRAVEGSPPREVGGVGGLPMRTGPLLTCGSWLMYAGRE